MLSESEKAFASLTIRGGIGLAPGNVGLGVNMSKSGSQSRKRSIKDRIPPDVLRKAALGAEGSPELDIPGRKLRDGVPDDRSDMLNGGE